MNLQGDLEWIEKELKTVEDPAFIAVIKNMLEYRKKILQHQHMSIEQYNIELDQAIQDIENGECYTQEEARKIANQW
jgi:hypothetical protein